MQPPRLLWRDDLARTVRVVRLRAGGCPALHTKIFVETAARENEEQPFAGRGGNSTMRAVEEGGIEGSKLTRLLCSDRMLSVRIR